MIEQIIGYINYLERIWWVILIGGVAAAGITLLFDFQLGHFKHLLKSISYENNFKYKNGQISITTVLVIFLIGCLLLWLFIKMWKAIF